MEGTEALSTTVDVGLSEAVDGCTDGSSTGNSVVDGVCRLLAIQGLGRIGWKVAGVGSVDVFFMVFFNVLSLAMPTVDSGL